MGEKSIGVNIVKRMGEKSMGENLVKSMDENFAKCMGVKDGCKKYG